MRVKQNLLVIILVLLPCLVQAADQSGFDRVDTDKSGSISRDELLKADLVLQEKQGKKQVLHRSLSAQGAAAAMTAEQKQHLFDQLDTDKNGQISRTEWSRASQGGFILWKF